MDGRESALICPIQCTPPRGKDLKNTPTLTSTQVQELAFTIADGMEYVKYGVASGLDIDKFAGRLSFFFAIGMNFFMEVAKLRAARVLWHRVMTKLGAQDERSKMLRTHCQTSGVKTADYILKSIKA